MKRLFIILLSVAALISASLFVSCSSDDSSSGGGGDNYYQGGNYGGSSGGNGGEDNDWDDENYDNNDWNDDDENYDNDDWEDNDDNYYVPSAPQNVTTKATSSSSIEVSWDAVEGADSYTVYYRLSLGAGNESYERDGTETVKTTSDTSVSIYDLTEWKIYIFFVTAQNSAGESFANIVFDYPCSTTDSDENDSDTATTPSAPTGLTANATSSSSIELSWDSVSGATTYYVYKSESSSYSTAIFADAMTSTFTTIGGLKANTTYYFWVKAFNGTTISDYSTYDYATTKAASSNNSGTVTGNTATIYFVGSSSAISDTGYNNIYVGNYQFGDLFTSVKTSKTLSAGTVDGPYQIKAGTYLLKFGNPTTGKIYNSTNVRTTAVKDRNGRIKGYNLSIYHLADHKFEFEEGKVYTISKTSGTKSAKDTSGKIIRRTHHNITAKEGTD